MAISIITAVILVAIAALIIICLPPSKSKIRADALGYANIGNTYSVPNIVVSKTNQDNGFIAEVQIEAVNKDNNDTNHIQLRDIGVWCHLEQCVNNNLKYKMHSF